MKKRKQTAQFKYSQTAYIYRPISARVGLTTKNGENSLPTVNILKNNLIENIDEMKSPPRVVADRKILLNSSNLTKTSSSPILAKIMSPGGVSKPTSNSPVDNIPVDYVRFKPRKISMEKERLYEEVLMYKNKMNAAIEENIKLKTKIANYERETQKYEKLLGDFDVPKTSTNQGSTMTASVTANCEKTKMIANLRKLLKELRFNLGLKEKEIEALKRGVKFTKLQELEIEKKSLIEETARLRVMAEKALKKNIDNLVQNSNISNLEEHYYFQSQAILTMEHDKRSLQSKVEWLESELNDLKLDFREKEEKYENKLAAFVRKIRDRDGQIEKIRKELDQSNSKHLEELGKQKKSYQIKISGILTEEKKNTQEINMVSSQVINELKQKLDNAEFSYKELFEAELKTNMRLTEENLQLMTSMSVKKDVKSMKDSQAQVLAASIENQIDTEALPHKMLLEELRYILMGKHVGLDGISEIIQGCFPEENKRRTSVNDLKEMLQSLQESDSKLLIIEILKHCILESEALSKLRFLQLRDIEEYFMLYLAGHYTIDSHLERTMDRYLEEIISQNHGNLRRMIASLHGKDSLISKATIKKIFKYIGVDISEAYLDLIMMRVAQKNGKIRSISSKTLLNALSNSQQAPLENSNLLVNKLNEGKNAFLGENKPFLKSVTEQESYDDKEFPEELLNSARKNNDDHQYLQMARKSEDKLKEYEKEFDKEFDSQMKKSIVVDSKQEEEGKPIVQKKRRAQQSLNQEEDENLKNFAKTEKRDFEDRVEAEDSAKKSQLNGQKTDIEESNLNQEHKSEKSKGSNPGDNENEDEKKEEEVNYFEPLEVEGTNDKGNEEINSRQIEQAELNTHEEPEYSLINKEFELENENLEKSQEKGTPTNGNYEGSERNDYLHENGQFKNPVVLEEKLDVELKNNLEKELFITPDHSNNMEIDEGGANFQEEPLADEQEQQDNEFKEESVHEQPIQGPTNSYKENENDGDF